MGWLGWSYAWVVVLVCTHHTYTQAKSASAARTRLAHQSSVSPEQDVLRDSAGLSFDNFPSWVAFPDCDRAEWLNVVLKKVWPHLGPVSNTIAKRIIEPKISSVLKSLNVRSLDLEMLSNFKLREFVLGAEAARVGGVKAYDRNTGREELVVDVELIYAGDARVLFSVQGLDCEINQVSLRATVRCVFKPLIEALPIVGGLELFLLHMPVLDYNLGGAANLAEIPGISNIIRGVLDKIIKRGFVWPNRLSLYLPLDSLERMEDKSYLLPAPSGVLLVSVVRGRDLVKKDLRGSSDPYVVLAVGADKVSFKERYVSKDVNPEWQYTAQFPLEEPAGLALDLKVYDYDAGSEDDFMGELRLQVADLVQAGSLEQVRHKGQHI